MAKSLELITKDGETINLIDSLVVSGVDIGEIDIPPFPFFDDFDNNNNGWVPSGAVPGDGFIAPASNFYDLPNQPFGTDTPETTYELLLDVTNVVTATGLTITIVNDPFGGFDVQYTFVPDVGGDISTPGVKRYTVNITDASIISDVDSALFFLFSLNGGPNISSDSVTINQL